jgi:DNA-binding NarL/FixJ family response regulator
MSVAEPGADPADRYHPVVPIRVALADDHLLVREGVRTLLEVEDDLEVVAICDDLDSLTAAIEQSAPDVVVTDIRMPPSGTDEGVRLATRLRESHPSIGVVVLSQYAEPAYALALLEHGSEGRAYLLKERVAQHDDLVDAIRSVAQGGSVIDPKVVESLVAARRSTAESPVNRLTPRENEVLAEMATGRNNAAIAARLVLSDRAVEKHINSIFSKLGLSEEREIHRRVAAVLLFLAERS